jgi:hypothetical protein
MLTLLYKRGLRISEVIGYPGRDEVQYTTSEPTGAARPRGITVVTPTPGSPAARPGFGVAAERLVCPALMDAWVSGAPSSPRARAHWARRSSPKYESGSTPSAPGEIPAANQD